MLYQVVRFLLRPLFHVALRMHVTGRENVPATGPVILASNHLSFIDSMVIPLSAPRRVHYLAKAEYFTGTGVGGWLTRTLFTALGAMPVERQTHRAAQEALDTALAVLRRGEGFGIYPEGTRSHDGRLYRGRTGVARLAIETGVPVVPVAVLGTDIVAPPGKKFGRYARPRVRFGRPLDFSRYAGLENDRFVLRSVTDEIMYEIMRLSGQEYVDEYASRKATIPLPESARPLEDELADLSDEVLAG